METKKFKFATDAAEAILPMGLQWDLFHGQAVEREEFIMFANCLDLQNPLYGQPDSYYVVNDEGSLGMTVDDCRHIDWLAKIVVPELPEVKMPPIAETPMMVVKDEIHDSIKNVKQLFTFKGIAKKAIITAVSMLVIWIFTIAWQRMCVYNDMKVSWIAKTVNYLTFAGGGFSKNLFYVLGGMVGKTFFMATLLTFVMGGYKKARKGFTVFMDNIKGIELHNFRALAFYFAGMGAACVLVNFFMGYAVMRKTMICFVGVAGMLWAMGGGINFIRRMTVACTADVQKQTRVRYVDMPNTMRTLTGMTIGFLVSFLPAWLLGGYSLYIFGTIFFVVAAALASVARQNNTAAEAPTPQYDTYAPLTPQAPNQPQYAPNQPQYAPNQWQYAPNQGQYAPNQPQYAPNQGQYAPNQWQYAPNQGQYAPNQRQYAPNQAPQYAPNQRQYAPNQAPQYAPNQPPQAECAPNPDHQAESAPDSEPKGGGVPTMPLVIALLLAFPFGMSASNWYLECVGVHTSRDLNTKIDGEVIEMADGSHVVFQRDDNEFDEIATANERYFRFTCTTPPSVIRKGDKVSLTIDNYDFTSVSYQYNMDFGGRINPPIDETTEYRDFLDGNGDSWSENPIDNGGPETRTVSLVFDDKFVGDMVGGDITEEVPDGTQMAIVYRSPIGETRWIYEYHSDSHYGAASDDDEEYEEQERELPYGESFEFPDDYGFLGEPESIWSWISSIIGSLAGLIGVVGSIRIPGNKPYGGSEGDGGEGGVPGVPRMPRPSDPYVKRREDGTIEYTNPITGEQDFYPPGTDEEEIRDQVEHVLRNREYYDDAYNKQQNFRDEERARVQKEIKDRNEEYERNGAKRAAEREAERIRQEKEPWLQDRMERYGVDSEKELRRELMREQGEAGAEYYNQMAKSHDAESGYIAAKAVKDSADVLMDAAAAAGGPKAQVFRDVYKATQEISQTMTDAALKGKNLRTAALAGTGRAAITVAQYHTGNLGWKYHLGATVGGEGARDVITALENGKSLPEALKDGIDGMKRGTKDFLVDQTTGAITDKVKGFAGNEYTGKIIDATGAAADDIGKIAGDSEISGGYGKMD